MGSPFASLLNRKDQLAKLMKLRQQQKKIARQEIHYQENGIEVTLSGDLKIKKLLVDGEEAKRLQEVLNKAYRKAQKVMAKQSQALLGDLLGM